MTTAEKFDIAVIGAGSGGLSVAAGAVQMGASVVLFEKGEMGGDCLNTGCVPSKALLAAAHAAHAGSAAEPFGIRGGGGVVDFKRVHDHVHGVIAAIAPVDSQDRFEDLGVTVVRAPARFTGPREIEADGRRFAAKWIVVATGSRPGVPPIPGLEEVRFLTNETVFDQTTAPDHLVIIGGGPIGMEMAQAHRRLGSQVTVIEAFTLMGKDDPDLARVVIDRLAEEGVAFHESVAVERVERRANGVAVVLGDGTVVEGSHLLVAAGRQPNVEGMDLEAAGIAYDRKGITTDRRLRTTNKRAFAVGDIAGGPQFTHVAGYHAGVVIRQMLFRLFWAKTDYKALPWVTYTDPELAQVGLTQAAAEEKHGKDAVRIVEWSYDENDRAQAERRTEGRIKVVLTKKGRILGASIVGLHAGELLLPWSLAIQSGMKIGKMAGLIAPYPTLSEVSKRAAGAWYTPSLFSEKTRKVVRFLMKFA